jgi:crossover junction endodeoxyribonuclease RusA
VRIVLPFPPASLAGHNNGHWRNRDREVASYRAEAFHLTKAAKQVYRYQPPATGDIAIAFHFVPSNDRGDRVNYPIRIKAQIDGIAEALGVNDKRFLPSYTFGKPEKQGRVEVEFIPTIDAEQDRNRFPETVDSAINDAGQNDAANVEPALSINAYRSAEV